MGAIFHAAPLWLWLILAAIVGGLLVLAVGPATDVFWELVWQVQRFCQVVGVLVLAGLAVWLVLLSVGAVGPPRF